MGINTDFCNVGNFGSVDRMDYTIPGAGVDLSAFAVRRGTRWHCGQLRNLRVGAGHGRGPIPPRGFHERHRPRGRALRHRGIARDRWHHFAGL